MEKPPKKKRKVNCEAVNNSSAQQPGFNVPAFSTQLHKHSHENKLLPSVSLSSSSSEDISLTLPTDEKIPREDPLNHRLAIKNIAFTSFRENFQISSSPKVYYISNFKKDPQKLLTWEDGLWPPSIPETPEKCPLLFSDVIELFGSYTSIRFRQPLPIFLYDTYKKKDISFHAFIINHDDYINAVILFDNYETKDKHSFQLRFAWWNKTERLHFDYSKLDKVIKEKVKLLDVDERLYTKTFLRTFEKSFIDMSLDKMIAKLEKNFHEIKQDENFIEDIPLQPIEWKKLYEVGKTAEIKQNNNYIFLLASDTIPEFAQNVALKYSQYLKREQSYDSSPYNRSKTENKHEIFFVLNHDYSRCIGLFIFKVSNSLNCNKLIELKKKQYESFKKKYSFTDSDAKPTLESQLKKARDKLKEAHLKNNDSTKEKYEYRVIDYIGALFFAKARNVVHLADKTPTMAVAWIHPFYRQQGILKKLWPHFVKRYGIIKIDHPSSEMRGFLDSNTASLYPQECSPQGPNHSYSI